MCRSLQETIALIENNEFPTFISFDNDLGENLPQGRDFLNWLIEYDMDNDVITIDFKYYVHSMNPVARDHIYGTMDSYLRFKFGE